MDEQGWIKVNRKLLNWEWYKETNTKSLFIHALLRANFDDQKFQGIIVPRGSFVSSYPNLAAETGLSVQNVRTALKRLISTGELTVKKYPKFTLFKVENYDMYQTPNSQTNSQLTGNQQASNSQLTTIKEIKNVRNKEIKNIYIAPTSNEAEPAIIEIPTNRNGEYYPVTQKMVDDWQELYPNVNILQELRKAKGWSLSNQAKRKTFKGMSRFLNSWFSREQDKNSYNQINQRKEDLPF